MLTWSWEFYADKRVREILVGKGRYPLESSKQNKWLIRTELLTIPNIQLVIVREIKAQTTYSWLFDASEAQIWPSKQHDLLDKRIQVWITQHDIGRYIIWLSALFFYWPSFLTRDHCIFHFFISFLVVAFRYYIGRLVYTTQICALFLDSLEYCSLHCHLAFCVSWYTQHKQQQQLLLQLLL